MRIAVMSMCVGTGMGMAGIFVSEHQFFNLFSPLCRLVNRML